MARILLIDDDEVARRAMGAILEEAEHEVTYAANGEIALALYAKRPFPLVLVDLVMPVKNGLQTISELMQLDKGARIVAFSGVSPEDLDLAAELGAARLLVKPVAPQDLIAAVNSQLGVSSGWDDVAK
jgi:DNA-binding response OmpR family regulator